ncbi:peptide chain release factor N(5)-glutamine methyltransferase [Planctomycetota bacterium]
MNTQSESRESLSIHSLYENGISVLEEAQCAYPQLEAEILLAHILGCRRLEMRMNSDRAVKSDQIEEYLSMIERRALGEPVAYLIGEQEFMSLTFKVGPGVLIPRRETEILVEKAVERYKDYQRVEGLDVGTGCGCIPISIITYLSGDVRYTGVDISMAAIRTALENSKLHRIDHKIEFTLSDMFSTLPRTLSYDLITANLPYVTEEEFTRVAPEVKDHEPSSAIVAGEDGLDLIQKFVKTAWSFLKPGGSCFIEIGYSQAEQVTTLFAEDGHYEDIEVFQDYSGYDRVVTAVKKESNG